MNKKVIIVGAGVSMIVGSIYGLIKATMDHIKFLDETVDKLCIMNLQHIQTELQLMTENSKLRNEKGSKK